MVAEKWEVRVRGPTPILSLGAELASFPGLPLPLSYNNAGRKKKSFFFSSQAFLSHFPIIMPGGKKNFFFPPGIIIGEWERKAWGRG